MKKLALLLLTLVLVVPVVKAEIPDISELTMEELSKLQTQIEITIGVKFGTGWTRIGSGMNVGGKTIKPGSYEILCVESDKYGDFSLFSVALYKDTDAYDTDPSLPLWGNYQRKPGDFFTITIEDGMVLVIGNGTGIIRKAQGLMGL